MPYKEFQTETKCYQLELVPSKIKSVDKFFIYANCLLSTQLHESRKNIVLVQECSLFWSKLSLKVV